MGLIADGPLLDTLRRVAAFGTTLVRLDVRQSSDRHTAVLDEITQYLGILRDGRSYAEWSEAQRQQFLFAELVGRRPLFPATGPPPRTAREVLATCAVIASPLGDGVAQYVISMATSPSDVLAVILLLRSAGVTRATAGGAAVRNTRRPRWRSRRRSTHCSTFRGIAATPAREQHVMIGYSDSAKDAGQFAAAWAQYRAQEQLVEVAQSARHPAAVVSRPRRRGRSWRRSGAPGHPVAAARFGAEQPARHGTGRSDPFQARQSRDSQPKRLTRYVTAVLEATLHPPPVPTQAWRERIGESSSMALAAYRARGARRPGFRPRCSAR